MSYAKTNDPDMIRDVSTGALINTNRKKMLEHKAKRLQASRLTKLEDDVESLKENIGEILEILRKGSK